MAARSVSKNQTEEINAVECSRNYPADANDQSLLQAGALPRLPKHGVKCCAI